MEYEKHQVDENGWTAWIVPNKNNWRVACCDCGLVHDFKFSKQVKVRVRRNIRATAMKRSWRIRTALKEKE